jgi:hypothetical protein
MEILIEPAFEILCLLGLGKVLSFHNEAVNDLLMACISTAVLKHIMVVIRELLFG